MKNEDSTPNRYLEGFIQNFVSEESGKKEASETYIKFLKLFWLFFDEISQRNKILRRKYILQILEKYLVDKTFTNKVDNSSLPKSNKFSSTQNSKSPDIQLDSIDIVNFKGFQSNPDGSGRHISFNKKLTIFFAPNGGGKSSLCEAIEWTLTGDTTEHILRGGKSEAYFQNYHVSEPSYKKTRLTLTDNSITLPNIAFDRMFLEKNRIEKFATISTQPLKDVQEILGELFGFSEIVNFFNELGQDIFPTVIEKDDTQNLKLWLDWESKKKELSLYIKQANDNLEKAENNLKLVIGVVAYNKVLADLGEQITKCDKELDNIGKDFGVLFSADTIDTNIKTLLDKIKQLESFQKDLLKFEDTVDFENLYQAANTLFITNSTIDKCPLCDTPILGDKPGHDCVVTNPQIKIKNELNKLQKLTQLRKNIRETENEINSTIFPALRSEWLKAIQNINTLNWEHISPSEKIPKIPSIDFSQLEQLKFNNFVNFGYECEKIFNQDYSEIFTIQDRLNNYKTQRLNVKQKEAEITESKKKLSDKVQHLENLKTTVEKQLAVKESYEKQLSDLNDQSSNSSQFKTFLECYVEFRNSLQKYMSKVILNESKDIDELVTGFYRALNLYDSESESVSKITFPKNTQEDFCIKYELSEAEECHALQILSEGHLKTLGLSALLARSVKLNIPVLVFDDAINAIDSDHRDNIATLLSGKFTEDNGLKSFGDKWKLVKNYINKCQYIITSHDRFFDEKIANMFNPDDQTRYVLFLTKDGVSFCEKGTPANYERKIKDFINPQTQDIRSAIFYSRIWFEEILLAITTHFVKPSNQKRITFENSVDPRTKAVKNPELLVLIDKIAGELKKTDTTDDEKKIAVILENIKQEKDGKYIWFFEILNQESHYRRYDHIDISNAPTSNEVELIFRNIQEITRIMETSRLKNKNTTNVN